MHYGSPSVWFNYPSYNGEEQVNKLWILSLCSSINMFLPRQILFTLRFSAVQALNIVRPSHTERAVARFQAGACLVFISGQLRIIAHRFVVIMMPCKEQTAEFQLHPPQSSSPDGRKEPKTHDPRPEITKRRENGHLHCSSAVACTRGDIRRP
jgi:hypothetical protein